MIDDRRKDMVRRLEFLKRDYAAQLDERIDEIVRTWRTAIATSEWGSALSVLTLHVHRLAGTAGIFGLHKVSRIAFALEEVLDRQTSTQLPSHDDMRQMEEHVTMLERCLGEGGSAEKPGPT